LLLAAAAGDEAAFEELYRLCQPMVLAAARTVARNEAISEEVAQDVWLQVWRLAHRYDPARLSAEGWLKLIAKRRAIDRVRVERHSADREVRWGTSESTHRRDEVADHVVAAVANATARRMLRQLTPLQREALTLAYWEGQTYRQIAERLRITPGAAKTRGYDALVRLRANPELLAWLG
jgi:RNA polymerase sigma-70 factor (ECF subfamily)